jgi:hypothetical protein
MTSHSQAAVIVTFEQVGDDVVASWSGGINGGTSNGYISSHTPRENANNGSQLRWLTDGVGYNRWSGGVAEYTGIIGDLSPDNTGWSGGWIGGSFFADSDTSSLESGAIIADTTWYFRSQTLDAIGASDFDNTLAWTSSSDDTVHFTTVPEPSSTALIVVGALALAVRRHR